MSFFRGNSFRFRDGVVRGYVMVALLRTIASKRLTVVVGVLSFCQNMLFCTRDNTILLCVWHVVRNCRMVIWVRRRWGTC